MKHIDRVSFGARLKQAFGHARNAEIARKLGVTDAAVKNYVEGRVPPADVLVTISDLTNCSIHWLLTGEGPSKTSIIEQEIETTDAEIIEEFNLEELRSVQELAAESQQRIATVIHLLSTESLISRGLLREPPPANIESLRAYPEEEHTTIRLNGEIGPAFSFKPVNEAETVQIPKHLTIDNHTGEILHPNSILCFRITTGELVEEGLHEGDLVVSTSIGMAPPPREGQIVAAQIKSQGKVVIRRFYSDPLIRYQVTFAPIKGRRPVIRLKYPQYQLLGVAISIVSH